MRLEIHRNFITLDECAQLNSWVDDGCEKGWLDNGLDRGKMGVDSRYTSRLYGGRFQYPTFILDLSKRIREFCGVSEWGLIEGHGRDGVVVSCTFPGGDVYEHQDPRGPDNLATLRCNIMTRAADAGGKLNVGGRWVAIGVGDLHCYLASEHRHYVTTVEGETSRVLWMFGAHVPMEAWESRAIKLDSQGNEIELQSH